MSSKNMCVLPNTYMNSSGSSPLLGAVITDRRSHTQVMWCWDQVLPTGLSEAFDFIDITA